MILTILIINIIIVFASLWIFKQQCYKICIKN